MWRGTYDDHDEDIETAVERHLTRLCYMSETYTSSQLIGSVMLAMNWAGMDMVSLILQTSEYHAEFFGSDYGCIFTASVHIGFCGICIP